MAAGGLHLPRSSLLCHKYQRLPGHSTQRLKQRCVLTTLGGAEDILCDGLDGGANAPDGNPNILRPVWSWGGVIANK